MKPGCIGVAVVLALGLGLLPRPAPVSGGGASTGGGRAGTTSGTTSKGGKGPSPGKSVIVFGSGATGSLRQPCDVTVVRGFGGARGFGATRFEGQSFLIVDATPLDAQVSLDGRLLGSARELVARALPVAPGRHTIEIVSPGFRPYMARFATEPGFPTRIRVTLIPE